MSNEITILLQNASSPGLFYSEKQKAAGYHRRYDSLHTAEMRFANWVGEITLQGTLELFPGENDWVDLKDELSNNTKVGNNSSTYNDPLIFNFRGNFVWIRAVTNTISGEIVEIRYNY